MLRRHKVSLLTAEELQAIADILNAMNRFEALTHQETRGYIPSRYRFRPGLQVYNIFGAVGRIERRDVEADQGEWCYRPLMVS